MLWFKIIFGSNYFELVEYILNWFKLFSRKALYEVRLGLG